jgi:DmsE family decaheme c-type cytochrome
MFYLLSASSAEHYDPAVLLEKSSVCLDCHDDMEVSLAETPHRISAKGKPIPPLAVGCIGCHDGWEDHIEDPSAETIVALSDYSLSEQAGVCGRCHISPHQTAMISTDPHGRAGISCLSCHQIHNNLNEMLVKGDGPDYCLSCHAAVGTEFKLRSAHPLESGNIRCTDCHNLGYIKDHRLAVGYDCSCQRCHSDFSGPYLYEHPVVYNHLVEGGGCVECHKPHGSPNDRLLNQPGNGVCFQCHGIPPGHRTQHDGLGVKLGCVDCHTAVHGSYENRLLLDPDLGMKLFPDCYQSGCHIFNN